MRERSKAAEVGLKVLDGFDKGRSIYNAMRKVENQKRIVLISTLVRIDQEAGHPARGRARRIRRKLKGVVSLSESQVRRILSTLYCVRDSMA